jgi:lysozyme family protein
LTLGDAQSLYRAKYWDANRCDEMPWPVNLVVFDAEVNSGSEGALALQHALGVKTDGDIGPVTLAAVKARDPVELAIEVMVSRDAFYHAIQQFATFGEGWIKRLFSVTWQAARAEN